MAITAFITRHSTDAKRQPRLSGGQAIAALGGQDGDNLDQDLTDGALKVVGPAEQAGLYLIKIDGADVRLRIGKADDDVTKGERWFDGDADLRFLRAGQVLLLKAG